MGMLVACTGLVASDWLALAARVAAMKHVAAWLHEWRQTTNGQTSLSLKAPYLGCGLITEN